MWGGESWYVTEIMNHLRVHYCICFKSLRFYPFTHLLQKHLLSFSKKQGSRNTDKNTTWRCHSHINDTLQISTYAEILAQNKTPVYLVVCTYCSKHIKKKFKHQN